MTNGPLRDKTPFTVSQEQTPLLGTMRFLFQKLEILHRRVANRTGESAWNIFGILRAEHDEVHLHSAFLAALLDPRGAHGCGSEFLALFFEMAAITIEATGDLEHAVVEVERRWGETGQIDLLITVGRTVLVVENKIYAADGYRQLERYYNYAHLRATPQGRAHVLYLTLFGAIPPAHSFGALTQADFVCLSYHNDVLAWLAKCVRVAARFPALRETLLQYETLIKKLTGKLMSEENREPTLALLAEGNNAVLASLVVENWQHVKWRTTWSFWQEIEETLVPRLRVNFPEIASLPHQRFSKDALDRLYFYKRGSDRACFGLMLKLGQLPQAPGDDVCLAMETGEEPSYYGLTMLRAGTNRGINVEPVFVSLREQIAPCSNPEPAHGWWLGWNYFKKWPVNFSQFTDEKTLALVNPTERAKAVAAACAEMEEFLRVGRVQEALSVPVLPGVSRPCG